MVKLIDVYPDDAPMGGFQMLLAGDVIRSKFRNSYTNPQPLVPGKVTRIEFSLLDKHHTFKAGHRIMVQIQSSWFPLIDRNPQVFLPIPEAKEEDFQIATHRVYHSPRYPSSIKILVLE